MPEPSFLATTSLSRALPQMTANQAEVETLREQLVRRSALAQCSSRWLRNCDRFQNNT